MKARASWWRQAGSMLAAHPALVTAAADVRGFGSGARWMHAAMSLSGWRMPPFGDPREHGRRGWMKYGICSISALLAICASWRAGLPWLSPLAAVAVFYAAEAQWVFLFPEALLGRRSPWCSSRRLTVAAGGTRRVMAGVLPIAARMLATGWWRGEGRRAWVQGCLAVVLWHRELCGGAAAWSEDDAGLPRTEIGPVNPLLLRREAVPGPAGDLRVLWISDLHWRGDADAGCLMALIDIARRERPGLIVLGGDFIDSLRALPHFRTLVRRLARRAPCVALPGNHDRGRFHAAIREAVESAGATWLPCRPELPLPLPDGGVLDLAAGRDAAARAERPVLALVHDPAELDGIALPAGSVVLAGHLHGGQVVVAMPRRRLLPAAWIYRHAWLRRQSDGVDWIVSRGAGDTLPLRWNCPREVILCEPG
jgi:predicted MPP superfamily phosphohydrolase